MEQIKFINIMDGDTLQSYKDYAIEFDSELELDIVKSSLGQYFQKVSSHSGILNYKNYVGLSNLIEKQVHVVSKKISRDEHDLMLKEIIEKMAQLPFDFNSPTNENFVIGDDLDIYILYHRYLILKYIIFDADVNLESSMESILRNPSRKNIYEKNRKEIWSLDKVSTQVFDGIIHNAQYLEKVPAHSTINQTMLAKKLKQKSGQTYFPMYAYAMELNNTLDTVENRFIKHFLLLAKDIIEQFHDVIREKQEIVNKGELIGNCKIIKGFLEEWIQHDLFGDVGEMDQIPFSSIILYKREGYKEVYQFHNMLNNSLYIPFSSEQLKLVIENKDIAEIYEIWTYIKTLHVIEEALSIVPESAFVVPTDEVKAYMKNSINVTYKIENEILTVWYNKTYKKGFGSYSLTLRPDIVVDYRSKKYIFDAKFKLDNLKWESDHESDVKEQQSFTFKNEDIYKMHTYKDAIRGAKFACILYPNPSSSYINFYKESAGGEGVGAIPLLPNTNIGDFKDFLKEYIFINSD